MMAFHDESPEGRGAGPELGQRSREATGDIQAQLRSMKFELPSEGEEKVTNKYEALMQKMMDRFASVVDE